MSMWSDSRDSFLQKLGVPTGIDFNGAPVPPEAASQAGAAAGNGIIQLTANALGSLFRPDAADAAATGAQATANTVARISLPVLAIGGVVLYMLLKKKR